MLSRLGEERLAAESDETSLRVLATRDATSLRVMLINLSQEAAQDRIVSLRLANLPPGRKQLTTYRIDAKRRWSEETLELLPVERREVETGPQFTFQVYSPTDTVTMITLEEMEG